MFTNKNFKKIAFKRDQLKKGCFFLMSASSSFYSLATLTEVFLHSLLKSHVRLSVCRSVRMNAEISEFMS